MGQIPYLVIKLGKLMTVHKVSYLHGTKQIGKWVTTYRPNRGQTPIILY